MYLKTPKERKKFLSYKKDYKREIIAFTDDNPKLTLDNLSNYFLKYVEKKNSLVNFERIYKRPQPSY